ncbi:MAG: sorbitol-6-phosphate 2-dehydrogenase [Candidatus Atribacteria bacterium]|nr:sorbitol-6-phosphate 2-dehydrogenase [Candidatus Atribacteria bacterium]
MEPLPLKDKIAVITGSASGIGQGIALRFAQEGSHVACWDLNLQGAEATASRVKEFGREAMACSVDVTQSSQIEAAAKQVFDRWGQIDILVNSAGIIKANFITEIPEEVWDAIITVNLKGTFLCIREIAKYMIERKQGKIISISSKSGKKGGLWLGAYCASKFGIIGLTQSAAMDLAPFKINVNAICPGNVFSTPMWDLLDKEYSKKLGVPPQEVRKIYREKVPLGRECTVEDVANVAVFLASSYSDYMTGQAINVTGGQEVH